MASLSSITILATLSSMQYYSHLKSNPLFHGKQSLLFTKPPSPKFFLKPSRIIPQLKCSLANQDNNKGTLNLKTVEKKGANKAHQIFPLPKSFGDATSKSFKGLQLQKPANIVGALIGVLVLHDSHAALAASGGRVGGNCFSSHSSTSSSSLSEYSSSSSSPRYSSSSSSSSSASPRYSSSSSSSSSSPRYSSSPSSSSSSSSSSSPSSSSPSSSSSPRYSSSPSSSSSSSSSSSPSSSSPSSSSSPRYSSSPSSSSSSSSSSSPSSSSSSSSSPSSTSTSILNELSYSEEIATFSSPPVDKCSNDELVSLCLIMFLLFLIGFTVLNIVLMNINSVPKPSRSEGVVSATDTTTVVKLQVGLLGTARSLQSDLNQIAEAADVSTPEGLHLLLTDVQQNIYEGEKIFNQLSIEERAKFDEETLVNANNIKKQTQTSRKSTGFSNDYIVITILVAAKGTHKLPRINNNRDLKDVLQKLASIPSRRTMAVEILWTPQAENDTLSERELLEDYPLLRPL